MSATRLSILPSSSSTMRISRISQPRNVVSLRSPPVQTPARSFASSRRMGEQPKTFAMQKELPRLPVPDLEKSLEGYVKSLIPVMQQKYEPSVFAKELEKRRIYARDFASPGGLGRVLQERIKDLDAISPNNWLNDSLWLSLAYHTWRAPLLINSNWWLLFAPDPADPLPPTYKGGEAVPTGDPNPTEILASGSQGGGAEWIAANAKPEHTPDYDEVTTKEWISDWQVRKGAWFLSRFAELRTKLQKEEIPPDSSPNGPACMSQYEKIFNLSRIPMHKSDAFSTPQPHALHASVMIDDFIYSVDVFSAPQTPEGIPEPLEVAQIESNLAACVQDAKARLEEGEKAARIGLLTADDRDQWTQNRERLMMLSPTNRASFDSISSSLITLSLDPYTIPSVPSSDPLRNSDIDAQIRNCASGIHGGQNRWFDKAIGVVVENTGRGGINGEHSPVDALIPNILIEYVLGSPVDQSRFGGSSKTAGQADGWKRLEWVTDEALGTEIEACQKRNEKIIGDSDASLLWWGEFGVDWIEKTAKVSPDAFMQQAIQLAWFRDQGYATATYQTAATRSFRHGRTDVIRSLTSESRDFVKAMQGEKSDASKRYAALQRACHTHTDLTNASSAGKGYDRHLMGLHVMLRPGESHALFDDEMYAKSQEWKLSTSGKTAGGKFMGTGFGAAWHDGYGISFEKEQGLKTDAAGPNLIKFGIESKFSCPVTSTAKFKHQLAQALRDMRAVCEEAGAE